MSNYPALTRVATIAGLMLLATTHALAAEPEPSKIPCDQCATWNAPQKPLRIYANTYYVGVHGLSAILITSDQGHVLLDGGLPESVPQIQANIQALGFRLQDIKLILNSHDHFDHAGGIAALQSASGASVAATAPSAKVLQQGFSDADDPQHGIVRPIQKVKSVRIVKDGETVKVGSLTLTAHATPGHTAGGTSWTWQSCEQGRCLNMVYADSLTAVSADGFKFSQSPKVLGQFEQSFKMIAALPCDVLMTPHPDISGFLERIEKQQPLVDTTSCKRYVEWAQQRLAKRLADERAQ